jgi:murein DD-endopeptidase MepM/ murein hydrolase activator NlpD
MNGVVRTGTTINGGNVIEIWSSYVGSDNKKYYVRVRYAHTSYASLGDGTEVKPGDLIGYSGNSGIPFEGMGAAYGYHLHYEVRISATFADLMDGRKSAKNPLTAGFGLEGIGTCH